MSMTVLYYLHDGEREFGLSTLVVPEELAHVLECVLTPDDQSAHVTTGRQLEQIEMVSRHQTHTRDVSTSKKSNHTCIIHGLWR